MKKIIILTLFLITIIFIAGCNEKNRYVYNDFTITRQQHGWAVTVYTVYPDFSQPVPRVVNLRYGPKELEDIEVDNSIKDIILKSENIYLTIDPNESSKIAIATIDLGKVLGTAPWGVFKIPTQSALTQPIDNITVKTCNDATQSTTIIYFKKGIQNSISNNNNCIVLEGREIEEIIKLSDRLALELLGVM